MPPYYFILPRTFLPHLILLPYMLLVALHVVLPVDSWKAKYRIPYFAFQLFRLLVLLLQATALFPASHVRLLPSYVSLQSRLMRPFPSICNPHHTCYICTPSQPFFSTHLMINFWKPRLNFRFILKVGHFRYTFAFRVGFVVTHCCCSTHCGNRWVWSLYSGSFTTFWSW